MSEELRSATLLRAALGHTGLVGPNASEWSLWIDTARDQRVIPLLNVIANQPDANLSALERDFASTMQLDVMASVVQLEFHLLSIVEELNRTGTRYAVLKGAATAHLDYAEPELRQFGDIDILVHPREHQRVAHLLSTLGWRQAYQLPRHHEQFAHAVSFRRAPGVEIDLHQRVGHRALGILIDTGALLATRRQYETAGRKIWALSDENRLIHAAVHAATSRVPYRRLSSVADVLVLADALTDQAGSVRETSNHWRVGRIVERSIQSAYTAAQLQLPAEWTSVFSNPHQQRPSLTERAYESERRRPVLEELAYLALMDGWRQRAKYVTGYFAVDDEYLADRHRSGRTAQGRYLLSRLRSK